MPLKSNYDKNKPLICVDGQPKSGGSMIDALNRYGKRKKARKSDDHVARGDAPAPGFLHKVGQHAV
jgi:hypothetical protein